MHSTFFVVLWWFKDSFTRAYPATREKHQSIPPLNARDRRNRETWFWETWFWEEMRKNECHHFGRIQFAAARKWRSLFQISLIKKRRMNQ